MEIEDAEEKKSFFNPGELFSAHLTYLAHTVPALNWMASHQPAEVITVTIVLMLITTTTMMKF